MAARALSSPPPPLLHCAHPLLPFVNAAASFGSVARPCFLLRRVHGAQDEDRGAGDGASGGKSRSRSAALGGARLPKNRVVVL
jgi:hypothetical protein